jgi:F-type H+-transporting ATPase subunit b
VPQLDPSGFSSQIFWLTVSFVVLYVLLARVMLPRIKSVLTLRADTIGNDIDQAKRMKADAELAREHYEKALAQARARSQAMLSETQAEIAGRATKRQGELDTDVAKKVSESQVALQAATRTAMSKISATASELAIAISESVVSYKPDAKAADKVVAGLISEKGI